MNAEQIHNILLTQHYPGVKAPARLVETHISWVILTPEFAFKIKKPVHFDFLDFSTLEQRQFYCAEEVRLNRRLSQDMYLGVLPIGSPDNWPAIGNETAPIIDYAIWMRRMDEQRQMDMLLAEDKVQTTQLEALADKLVAFHQNAILGQENVYAQGDYLKDFEDLYHEEQDAVLWLGEEVAEQFKHWRQEIPAFIQRHSIRMRARFETGFWVEGHGDLHTRNIFLLEEPVVFDCIEFNAHFRQLDVLNELAFLCMDLEAGGRADLAAHFMRAYREKWQVMPNPEDKLIFQFFKAYRANIRLKVSLLALRSQQDDKLLASVNQYWILLKDYCSQICP